MHVHAESSLAADVASGSAKFSFARSSIRTTEPNARSYSEKRPINRGIELSLAAIKNDKEDPEDDLKVLEGRRASLWVDQHERPSVGTQKATCSSCHFHGHRRSSCRMPPCEEYTHCGIIVCHPELKKKKAELHSKIKGLQVQIKKKNDEFEAVKAVSERACVSFFSVMRPCLRATSPINYM